MIIVHEPVRSINGAATRVTARVDIPGAGTHELWFEVEGEGASFLSDRGDAFAAALLPVAAAMGETLEVRGAVSPRLAWGLGELLRVHRVWFPGVSRQIELVFPRLEEAPRRGAYAGCGFSGGVDSLFTMLRYLPRNQRTAEFAITHLVMINGFDLDDRLDDGRWFAALKKIYAPLAEAEGLRFMSVRTNLSKLMQLGIAMRWMPWAGALLVAPALALSDGFARYVIGATGDIGDFIPYGTSPLTDPLYSTDTLQIIHDGADATRSEKLDAIAEWAATWDRLRVCRTWRAANVDVERGVVRNCGKCEKCIRTMTGLATLGKLDRFKTFRRPLRRWRIALAVDPRGVHPFALDNLRSAVRNRRYDLALPLAGNIVLTRAVRLLLPLVRPVTARLRRVTTGAGAAAAAR